MQAITTDAESARKQFLLQRNEMMKQARKQDKDNEEGSPNAFADFSSFEDNTQVRDNKNDSKSNAFDAPGDVTDATGVFFEAITAPPPIISTEDSANTSSNNKNIVSGTRHAELLKAARQDQVAWVEKDVVSHSPPAPSFVKGIKNKISSIDEPADNVGKGNSIQSDESNATNNKNNVVVAIITTWYYYIIHVLQQ